MIDKDLAVFWGALRAAGIHRARNSSGNEARSAPRSLRGAWKKRLALLGAAELATLLGVDETSDAFLVIGARRLAERFPFFDAGSPCLFVFPLLRQVTRRIVEIGRRAHPAVELAVGTAFHDLPCLRRCRHQGENCNRIKNFH